MNPVGVVLRPTDSVGRALSTLLGNGVGSAPVVDEHLRPLGVLSLSDILRSGRGSTAADRMTRPAVTVTEETAASVAARLMTELNLASLPVVDWRGRLVGLVGVLDLLRLVAAEEDVSFAA